MQVDDAVEAVEAVLQRDEAGDRAEVIAEVQVAGRLDAGKHPLLERRHRERNPGRRERRRGVLSRDTQGVKARLVDVPPRGLSRAVAEARGARRAKVEERAAAAGGRAVEAAALPVQHQDLVVVVDACASQSAGSCAREHRVRRPDVHPRPDQPACAAPPGGGGCRPAAPASGASTERQAPPRWSSARPRGWPPARRGPRRPHPGEEIEGRGPRGAPATAASTAWMRGAFSSGQVTPAIAASTSATGAARGRPSRRSGRGAP